MRKLNGVIRNHGRTSPRIFCILRAMFGTDLGSVSARGGTETAQNASLDQFDQRRGIRVPGRLSSHARVRDA
eukprot:356005-Rhodomonas_salina.1